VLVSWLVKSLLSVEVEVVVEVVVEVCGVTGKSVPDIVVVVVAVVVSTSEGVLITTVDVELEVEMEVASSAVEVTTSGTGLAVGAAFEVANSSVAAGRSVVSSYAALLELELARLGSPNESS